MKTNFLRSIRVIGYLLLTVNAISAGAQSVSTKRSLSKNEGSTDTCARIHKTRGSNVYHEVRCAIKDKEGNLWFGTTGEGVYKYDGKRFVQFTRDNGIGSDAVWALLQDRKGTIWLGTDVGLCQYDGLTFKQIVIDATKNYPSFGAISREAERSANAVWAMLEDKNGKLWICAKSGVYCRNNGSFSEFPGGEGIINNDGVRLKNIGYILQDKDSNIWFGSGVAGGDGICRYDGKEIISFKPDGDTWIRYIVEDRKGNIWLGTRSHGNWRYDGHSFSRFTEKSGIGAPIIADESGNIWFGGEEHDNGYSGNGGIWRYNGKEFTNYTERDGMGNYGVWCMLVDDAGNIWVGTRNTGLYRFNGRSFKKYSE